MQEFLAKEADAGFTSLDKLYDWYANDLSEKVHVDAALDGIGMQALRLRDGLTAAGTYEADIQDQLEHMRTHVEARLHERGAEIDEQEDRRADYMQDEWKEDYRAERDALERGRFADVDE